MASPYGIFHDRSQTHESCDQGSIDRVTVDEEEFRRSSRDSIVGYLPPIRTLQGRRNVRATSVQQRNELNGAPHGCNSASTLCVGVGWLATCAVVRFYPTNNPGERENPWFCRLPLFGATKHGQVIVPSATSALIESRGLLRLGWEAVRCLPKACV